jgi:hypothetical protein
MQVNPFSRRLMERPFSKIKKWAIDDHTTANDDFSSSIRICSWAVHEKIRAERFPDPTYRIADPGKATPP